MEAWQRALRCGFFPNMPTAHLEWLLRALECDDKCLVQGMTCYPLPDGSQNNSPVQAGCFASYPFAIQSGGFEVDRAGVRNPTPAKVQEVEEGFGNLCLECDRTLGEVAGCRHFLNWYDDTPRAQAFALIAVEIASELFTRGNPSLQGSTPDGRNDD